MPLTEIERKFLVNGDFKSQAVSSTRISQGYIASGNGRTVRVRIRGEKGYLTIKGPSNKAGLARFEWEKEIPAQEADELLALCLPGKIEKQRWLIPLNDSLTCEVDEFSGLNQGLVMAEIELQSEDQPYDKPAFLGNEVTGDARYFNSYLIAHPYCTWQKE